jgi:hypothetical protein
MACQAQRGSAATQPWLLFSCSHVLQLCRRLTSTKGFHIPASSDIHTRRTTAACTPPPLLLLPLTSAQLAWSAATSTSMPGWTSHA